MPKALVHDPDGTSWLLRSVRALRDGGCAPVVVVLGCEHERATDLLEGQDVTAVVADDWADGMGVSLRTGLQAAGRTEAACALVSLVDLPDVDAAVVARVLRAEVSDETVLVRAAYGGAPGHPVLLGRAHWDGVGTAAVGDRGARDYLARARVSLVECGDLASGRDVDSPQKPVIEDRNGR